MVLPSRTSISKETHRYENRPIEKTYKRDIVTLFVVNLSHSDSLCNDSIAYLSTARIVQMIKGSFGPSASAVRVCFFLPLYPSFCLPTSLGNFLSLVERCMALMIHPIIHLMIHLIIHLIIHLMIHLIIHLMIHLMTHLNSA